MSDVAVSASDIVNQSTEVVNEVPTQMPEQAPVEGEAKEQDAGSGDVVESGESQTERSAFARQFANLARQERRVREERQQLKGVKKKANELEGLQDMAKDDPMGFLDKFGISYDALTRRVINDGNVAVEDIVAEQAKEIESLKAFNRKQSEEREERQKKKEYEQTYTGFVDKIKEFVDNDSRFEMVKANNAYHTVYEVMQEQYAHDGTVLEYDKAAEMVEQYYEGEAERYFKSSKLRDRYKGYWQPEPEEAQDVKPSQQAAATKPRPKTLSNQLTSQTPARDDGLLSREESLARAAAIMRGEI